MIPSDALYPIREICRITGVNPITLRAWERRYGLIEPVRTESGHRLYTQQHIDEIKAAVKLTEKGIPISQVKQLLEKQAQKNQVAIHFDSDDLLEQLKKVISDFDLVKLSQNLDMLFADTDEATLNHHLRRLVLEQDALPRTHMALLEAQLLPRLYTRLRFATRNFNLASCLKIWVQPESGHASNEILLLLVALYFAQQGIYPVLHINSENDNQVLFTAIQQLHCEGLAIVAHKTPLNETLWDIWTNQHKSLEFYYFITRNALPALDHKLQCHYFNLSDSF